MKKDLKILRHSAAHLLGHAVSELFPGTLLTIGPATENGFFYDFLPAQNFKESDLATIEVRMKDLAEKNIPLEHSEIPKNKARELYKNNPFKLELINDIPGETVGLATQGDFYDLCRGGHVASTGELKNFRLTGISGSYWRADKSKPALQRISGTAFYTAEELAAFEHQQEEALKRDHRRIGKQLDYFSFHEEGAGFPFFHPKGKAIINLLTEYMRSLHKKYNYQEISTPTMLSDVLWHRSGHYDHYKKNMYFCLIEDHSYAIKPMNCPGSILVYQTRPRSYRELPFKLAEFGHVHRHELSGVLHGLLRVRAFTIDDAHIYCTVDQIEENIKNIIAMAKTTLARFGFDNYRIAISTKPDNAMGSDAIWQQATNALKSALDHSNISYDILEGEGAFYGPKIEVIIEDSMGRTWTCGTAQLDFFQPENFDLSYVASSGKLERPVIIHQAIYGSLERFFAIMLEHHNGVLPFSIAPLQARIMPITDQQISYAQDIFTPLAAAGLRVDIDDSSDPLAGQIKRAQEEKLPWMLIVGKKEMENKTITLRHRDGKQEFGLTIDTLITKMRELTA